jgi:hypothetical protein
LYRRALQAKKTFFLKQNRHSSGTIHDPFPHPPFPTLFSGHPRSCAKVVGGNMTLQENTFKMTIVTK